MNTDSLMKLLSFLVSELEINQNVLSDVQIEQQKHADGGIQTIVSLSSANKNVDETGYKFKLKDRSVQINQDGLRVTMDEKSKKTLKEMDHYGL